MTTHTIISDYENDNIKIFYVENNFLAVVKQEDFTTFKKMEVYNNAGICILISRKKTSIHKISTSLFDNINHYCSNNPWWETLIFIGDIDNNISEIELSYIEKLFIDKITSIETEIDNSEQNININIIQKIKSNKIIDLTCWVLNSYTNINLFKKKPLKIVKKEKLKEKHNTNPINNILNSPSKNKKEKPSIIFDNMSFSESSMRKLLQRFVSYLFKEGYDKKIIDVFYDQPVPSASKFIGKKHKYGLSGDRLTHNVEGTDFIMYTTYSKEGVIRTLNKISKTLNKPIEIKI